MLKLKFILPSFLLINFFCGSIQSGECFDLSKRMNVIVIGAGAAGLAAAQELRADGQEVLVLEGNNRIGGRISSVSPWGSTVELGASWIHGVNENPIGTLAKKLNLTLLPTRYNHKCLNCQLYDFDLRESNGNKIDDNTMFDLKKLVSKFLWYINNLGKDSANQYLSVEEALKTFVQENAIPENLKVPFIHMARTILIFEEAEDLDQITVTQTDTYSDKGASGDDVIIVNGYNQIVGYLAQNLHILLNEKVTKINHMEDGVVITTSTGKEFHSDYVVVTVPLGVLQKEIIKFDPPLPKEKIKAINELEMGVMNKIYLFFPCSFWDTSTEWLSYIPKDPKEGLLYTLNLTGLLHQPILAAFTVGSFAKELENKTDQENVDYVMNVLRKIYGEKIPSPSASLITRWGKDPFSYGSFSLMTLKTSPESYEVMSRPVGDRLFFAGESANTIEQGTVYGAYMSGVDAAKKIIESSHLPHIKTISTEKEILTK